MLSVIKSPQAVTTDDPPALGVCLECGGPCPVTPDDRNPDTGEVEAYCPACCARTPDVTPVDPEPGEGVIDQRIAAYLRGLTPEGALDALDSLITARDRGPGGRVYDHFIHMAVLACEAKGRGGCAAVMVGGGEAADDGADEGDRWEMQS